MLYGISASRSHSTLGVWTYCSQDCPQRDLCLVAEEARLGAARFSVTQVLSAQVRIAADAEVGNSAIY